MENLISVLLQASFVWALLVATACTGGPTAGNNNQANVNTGTAASGNSNAPQSQAASDKSRAKPEQAGTGSIEVKTVPPGARVVLISLDEASPEPQQKGSTPTTITDVPVGKYTVNIEKPGYKYYQKNVKVEENKTIQVGAKLQKE
ncbi:MAG TPA: PEGA domain-containing protein [Blastocatellia bacterium]|jgi:hypothetical protein